MELQEGGPNPKPMREQGEAMGIKTLEFRKGIAAIGYAVESVLTKVVHLFTMKLKKDGHVLPPQAEKVEAVVVEAKAEENRALNHRLQELPLRPLREQRKRRLSANSTLRASARRGKNVVIGTLLLADSSSRTVVLLEQTVFFFISTKRLAQQPWREPGRLKSLAGARQTQRPAQTTIRMVFRRSSARTESVMLKLLLS